MHPTASIPGKLTPRGMFEKQGFEKQGSSKSNQTVSFLTDSSRCVFESFRVFPYIFLGADGDNVICAAALKREAKSV